MTNLSEEDYLVNNGRIALKEGNFDGAIIFFMDVLKLNSKNDDALYHLGSIYNTLGDYDLAVNYLEKALLPRDDSFKIWSTIADAYKMKKEYKKAIYAYKKALEFNPDNESKIIILSTIDNLVLKADYSTD
ncbi:MAG: tetratricopeptide repeat protein [Candidatus Heimdallarchaeota archaeon]|nr:tetratricopeptide repeat protein [Candidatus Heimdallarchaeota archaeon]